MIPWRLSRRRGSTKAGRSEQDPAQGTPKNRRRSDKRPAGKVCRESAAELAFKQWLAEQHAMSRNKGLPPKRESARA